MLWPCLPTRIPSPVLQSTVDFAPVTRSQSSICISTSSWVNHQAVDVIGKQHQAPSIRNVLLNTDLVLLEWTRHPHATSVSCAAGDWCLLYQDSVTELWGRAGRFNDSSSPCWLPESSRHISDGVQEGSVAWPAFPVHLLLVKFDWSRQPAGAGRSMVSVNCRRIAAV